MSQGSAYQDGLSTANSSAPLLADSAVGEPFPSAPLPDYLSSAPPSAPPLITAFQSQLDFARVPDSSTTGVIPEALPGSPTPDGTVNPLLSRDCAQTLEEVALEWEDRPLRHYYENGCLVWYDTFVRDFVRVERDGRSPALDPALQAHASRVAQHAADLRRAEVRWQTLLQTENELWPSGQASISGSGPCLDGRMVNVQHAYDKVTWGGYPSLNRWRSAARDWRSTLEEDALLARFQVSTGYRRLAVQLGSLSRSEAAALEPSDLAEVRKGVSALFRALRGLSPSRSHASAHDDLVSWLRLLVSQSLSRSNNLADTLFVLNHLLRCPNGVGQWGACLLQIAVPRSPAPDEDIHREIPFFDLQVTVLYALCTSPRARTDFVRPTPTTSRVTPDPALSANTTPNSEEEPWSVLNCQGSEISNLDGQDLSEVDLLPLFDRLNIPACLEFCVKISLHDATAPNQGCLRSLAMVQSLLNVLRDALKTFHEKAFDKVLKRVCEFMECALWTLVDLERNGRKTLTNAQSQRVRLECVSMLTDILAVVMQTGNSICFQRFVYLPLDCLTSDSIPQVMSIFYGRQSQKLEAVPSINLPVSTELPSLALRLKNLHQDNRNHLFRAMTTLLQSVDHTVSLQSYLADFLVLGFSTFGSFERYPELCTTAIASLAHGRPGVISQILPWLPSLGNDPDCRKDVMNMLLELPIENWIPQAEDIDLLCERLALEIHDPVRQEWTQTILDGISWDNALLEHASGEKVALVVVEIVRCLADESSVTWNAAIWSNPTETSFLSWAWHILPKLRLHLQEQKGTFQGNAQWSDYDQEPRFHHLRAQVNQSNPVAAFVALQLTQLGHSVPEICERGWKVLKIALHRAPVEAVLICFFDMATMFLDCPHDLVDNEDFQIILTSLLVGEMGVLQSAKEITGFESKHSVALIMQDWILLGLAERKRNEEAICTWIELWLLVLTSHSDWNCNRIILQILNAIVEFVFGQEKPRRFVVAHFALNFKVKLESEDSSPKNEGFTSWIKSSHSPFTFVSAASLEFPWLASCLILAEECHPTVVQFCDQVVSHLDHPEASVDEAVRIVQQGEIEPNLNWTANELPIYRWSKLFLAIVPKDLAVSVIAFQKFASSFFWKTKSKDSSNWMFVGPAFFQGFVNSRYLGKIKAKLMFCEAQAVKLESKQLFQAFHHWINDPELLDPKVHVPSLPKNMFPNYLSRLVDHTEQHHEENQALWMDLMSSLMVDDNSQQQPDKKSSPVPKFIKVKSQRPKIIENVENQPSAKHGTVEGLQDHLAHLSVFDAKTSYFQIRETLALFSRELISFVEHWNVISDDLQSQLTRRSDLLAHLFKQEQRTVVLSGSCPTSFGLKGPRYCSGPAQIRLDFDQWVQQDNVKQELCDNLERVSRLGQDLEQRVLSRSLIATMTNIQVLVELLTSKTKQTMNGKSDDDVSLGLEVIHHLASILTEDRCRLPLVKHFFSTQLESLAEAYLSNEPSQSLTLFNYLAEKPFLMSYLSSCFTPNVAQPADFIAMYSKIVLLEHEEHAFVLLSKISISDWYKNVKPSLEFRSDLIRVIGEALHREMRALESNPSSPPGSSSFGSLLLDKHEQNLHHLGRLEFPSHYFQLLNLLLELRQNQNVKIWFDFLHLQVPPDDDDCKPLRLNSHPREIQDYLKYCRQYMTKFVHYTERKEIDLCILKLRDFFDEERHQTGLNGIYSKYDQLYVPISILIAQLSQFLLIEALSAQDNLESVWQGMWAMFCPWLCPIAISELRTAQWIQDLATDNRVLLPWTLEETSKAVFVADILVLMSHDIGLECKEFTKILSLLWQMYCQQFALLSSSSVSGVKDHILEVMQAALIKLPWNTFLPTRVDFQLMVNLKDCDIMVTHVFVGKIFTQIAWKKFLAKNASCLALILKDFIAFFLWVRFGPDFRQKNIDLLRICLTFMDSSNLLQMSVEDYTELLNLFVTRVDSKVIAHIFDHESVDGNMIRFFDCSGDSSNEVFRVKSIALGTNILKLFDHCFKKYPKFVLDNHPDLVKGFHWFLAVIEHQWKQEVEGPGDQLTATSLKDTLLICLESSSSLAKFVLPELCCYLRSNQSSFRTKRMVLEHATGLTERFASLPLATIFESCVIGLWETSQVKSWSEMASFLNPTWPSLDLKRDSMVLRSCFEAGLCKQLVLRAVLITSTGQTDSLKTFETTLKWMRDMQLTLLSSEDFALLLWILLYLLDNVKSDVESGDMNDEASRSKASGLSLATNDLMGFLYTIIEPSHGYSSQIMSVFGLSTVSSFKPSPVLCLVFYSLLEVLSRSQSSAPPKEWAIRSNTRDPTFKTVITSVESEDRYQDLLEWIQPYLPTGIDYTLNNELSDRNLNAPYPKLLTEWFTTLCQKATISNGNLFMYQDQTESQKTSLG